MISRYELMVLLKAMGSEIEYAHMLRKMWKFGTLNCFKTWGSPPWFFKRYR